jgi:Protein kinase G tetratricopeptide repeat
MAVDPSALLVASLIKTAEDIKAEAADDYTEWRKKSELFLLAIGHLEKRELEGREDVTLLGIPFFEAKLREAAETALRNCAHFAQSFEERIAFVDSANRVRNVTWF